MASAASTKAPQRLRWRGSVAWREESFGAILYDHASERLMLVRGVDIARVAPVLKGERPAVDELAQVVPVARVAEVLDRLWSCGVLEVADAPG
jgi:putative mycofactocin binding protein MftB